MKIKIIEFLQSVADWRKAPSENYPEYAFIGRSNCWQNHSLINI